MTSKKFSKGKTVYFISAIIVAFLGGVLGQKYLFFPMGKSSLMQDSIKPIEKSIKYWVAPMDATYRRDNPGKSPMGMDLVPVYEESGSKDIGEDNIIKISPTVEHNLGIRTATVTKKDISRNIDTVGFIAANENQMYKSGSVV